MNTEGRVQRAALAAFPVGEAKEDWAIIRALSDTMGKKLPYDSLPDLRRRMADINPLFATLDETSMAPWGNTGDAGTTRDTAFEYPIYNFYMTDAISRASEIMAECTAVAQGDNYSATGTNG